MELLNQNLKHIVFGEGKVVRKETEKIYIQFSEQYGVKQFIYPDAFEKYLKILNAELEVGILKDLSTKKLQINAEKVQKQQQYEEEVKNQALEKSKLAAQKKKAPKKSIKQ